MYLSLFFLRIICCQILYKDEAGKEEGQVTSNAESDQKIMSDKLESMLFSAIWKQLIYIYLIE